MCYNSPGPRCAYHIGKANAANPEGVQESIPSKEEHAQKMQAWRQSRLTLASDLETPLSVLTKMQSQIREPRTARLAACKNLVIRHPFYRMFSLNAVIGMAGIRAVPTDEGAVK